MPFVCYIDELPMTKYRKAGNRARLLALFPVSTEVGKEDDAHGFTGYIGYDFQRHQNSTAGGYTGYTGTLLCGISRYETDTGNTCRSADQGYFSVASRVHYRFVDQHESYFLSSFRNAEYWLDRSDHFVPAGAAANAGKGGVYQAGAAVQRQLQRGQQRVEPHH